MNVANLVGLGSGFTTVSHPHVESGNHSLKDFRGGVRLPEGNPGGIYIYIPSGSLE